MNHHPLIPSQRLAELGLELPPVTTPVGTYRPACVEGDHVLTSGQLPLRDGTLITTGLVGDDVDPAVAQEAARQCALNALAAAAAVVGGVDALEGVVKVTGFVASVPSFTGQPTVVNGASDLLGSVFGEAGVHVRSAVGVAALPMGAPVEVEVTFRVR